MHIDVTYYSIAYRILSVASPLYIKPVQVDLCTLGLFWRGDTVEVREMESLSYCHLRSYHTVFQMVKKRQRKLDFVPRWRAGEALRVRIQILYYPLYICITDTARVQGVFIASIASVLDVVEDSTGLEG